MSLAPYQQPQYQQYPEPRNGLAIPQAAVVSSLPAQVASLAEWAQSAQAAFQVAELLVTTPFVPEAFRNKPHDAAAAILSGGEVGLSPMASLRSFDVIQGTAAPRAITLRAIVQSRGHDVWLVEQTDSRAIVAGKRAGSNREQKSEWTIQRAQKLGLTNKANWKNQPGAMLVARATSELCRLIASDAILGLPYSAEEIADGVTPDDGWQQAAVEPEQQPAAAKRTAQRSTRTAVKPATRKSSPPSRPAEPDNAAGPPLPGEDGFDTPPAEDAPATDGPTPDQMRHLHRLLTEFGFTAREDYLMTCSLLIRRWVESSKNMTKAEATRAIDQLLECEKQGADSGKALDALLAQCQEEMDAADAGDRS